MLLIYVCFEESVWKENLISATEKRKAEREMRMDDTLIEETIKRLDLTSRTLEENLRLIKIPVNNKFS